MLGSGNAAVGPCAYCLLTAMQREIPFARSKGIDPDVYDVPLNDVGPYLDESARDTLAAYEPRVKTNEVNLQLRQVESDEGAYYTVTLSDKQGDINDYGEGDDD